MVIYVLSGWICAVAPIGCQPMPILFPEYYETEAACLRRIDFFKNNTNYVLSSDLKCETIEIELPPQS